MIAAAALGLGAVASSCWNSQMRRTILWLAFVACIPCGHAQANPSAITLDQLFSICESRSVSEAVSQGDRLGWQRSSEAQLDDWRQSFVGYNGGSVEVVGWRRGEPERGDSLQFWVAEGPNSHKACYYSASDAAGLLDALSQRIGKPDSLDKNEVVISAHWKTGSTEVYYSQAGAGALVNISSR
ncbi:hypothetical protein G6N74_06720 [Mesorhizobium sp. CGMCC 1.15528]|uniref:Uncharacterized protein n=1 Tax=Mesorhizobium zhangyense TaxID=1776730 RepID=A0A7C9VAY7_9HYPH|nr:hypothetical protein [Mesorhizobium zhangyense]NGN40752.1 hypothetical protein [Mesorhizobium zhangyense]